MATDLSSPEWCEDPASDREEKQVDRARAEHGMSAHPGTGESADARKEHERALARERQRRRRSRISHGVTMVNGHAVTPGARRLMAVAQAVAQGTPMQTALRNQGFPESSQSVKTQAHDLLRASLVAGAVTVDKVVRSTRESLDATSPMLTAEGCIERPDWAARATGRRDAIALLDRAGELPQLQQATGHSHVTLTFNSLNVTLPDVVVSQGDNDCEIVSVEKD